MDKQTKFVFEKFEDFIEFLQENVLNEANKFTSLSEIQSFMGSNGMDKDGKTAFSQIEELAKKSSFGELKSDDFNALALTLNKLSTPDVTEITDISVYVNEGINMNSIAGTVVTEDGSRVSIADLFTKVNSYNLSTPSKVPELNKEKKKFENSKDSDKGFFKGSGHLRQYMLLNSPGKMDFKKYTEADPVKNEMFDSFSVPKVYNKDKDGDYYTSFFLYWPKALQVGQGEEITSTEIVATVRPVSKKSTKLSPIVIQNDDVLFELNKSVLKEEGKAAILNALSNVATAKSIVVTGGASKEGDVKRNETLCKERAQAVADFLKQGSFKNAEITVSEVADIQPQDNNDPLPNWRKVTLDVEGETLIEQKTTVTETVFNAQSVSKKMDKLTFVETRINISSQIIK
jgi:outer membrane protein OmpA-like peptidoglycan-associated protein